MAFYMDVDAQADLIREFMLAIAPVVTKYSLESGSGVTECAMLTLECSMHLAARYNELCETLTAQTQNSAPSSKQQTPSTTSGIPKAQARIPLKQSDVPRMPEESEHGRTSPLLPSWKPPSAYE